MLVILAALIALFIAVTVGVVIIQRRPWADRRRRRRRASARPRRHVSRQLLLAGLVKLPSLRVDLPLFAFYGFAPPMFARAASDDRHPTMKRPCGVRGRTAEVPCGDRLSLVATGRNTMPARRRRRVRAIRGCSNADGSGLHSQSDLRSTGGNGLLYCFAAE